MSYSLLHPLQVKEPCLHGLAPSVVPAKAATCATSCPKDWLGPLTHGPSEVAGCEILGGGGGNSCLQTSPALSFDM